MKDSERVFSVKSKRKKIEEDTEPKKSKKILDVRFINPFLEATQAVMRVQVNTVVEVEKPYILSKDKSPDVSIGGVIKLSGNEFEGAICLAFDKPTLIDIFKNMTGNDPKGLNDLVNDCAAELLNIIHGTAKKEINSELGMGLDIAVPELLLGDKLKLYIDSKPLWMVLPFKTGAGSFYVFLTSEDT